MNTSVILRLLKYGLNHKAILVQASLLLLLATGLDMLAPWLTMIYIDQFVAVDHYQVNTLVGIAVIYIGVIIGANLLSYFQSLSYFDLSAKVIAELRQASFQHCLKLPMAYFHQHSNGETINRMTQDVEAVRHLFKNIIGRTIRDIFTVIAVIISMLLLNVQLALVCIAFIPVFIAVFVAYRHFSLPLHRKIKQQSAKINGFLNESLQQVLLLQVFNAQPRFIKRLNDKAQTNIALSQRNVTLEALLLRPMLELLAILMMAALILSLGAMPSNLLAFGLLFAFFAYLARFFEPIINLMQSQGELLQAVAAAERVFQLLDHDIESSGGSLQLNHCPTICFHQVSFAYVQGEPVLSNLDLTIAPGEFVALVGPTGSGKSTIAQLLKGYYQANSGHIQLDQHLISHYQTDGLRKAITLVDQKPFIMQASVRQNLLLDLVHPDDAQLHHVLAQVELAPWLASLPQGLDTSIDNNSPLLTLGQKQLLCFARALLQNSSVIILDEASASLDPASEQAIQRVIAQLRGKVSLLVIAHKLSNIKMADKIAVLQQGVLMQQGKHADLVKNKGAYQQLLASNDSPPSNIVA
ncbi:ABC transporter ATP-binding protein/permease [Motilimonas cestriensis]|uniref:ABC transporter ATP-binding protein/permease n=1 Tax=Motilimonas cestriensis TaxID=2742685 RepID=A0ABS8WG26_9GAMM|nr:ABC transporter ATP-binding protein [Motilimonas cestriensis]MCE2597225.1 ABC transporter ATP-binding protein/permease [Motilimonas cestriensis]